MYNIIQKRNIWLTISGTMVALSIIAVFLWQLDFGIDFTGGSLLEVEFRGTRPTPAEVDSALAGLDLGSVIAQPVGDKGMIIRFQDITENKHQETLKALEKLVGTSTAPISAAMETSTTSESAALNGTTSTSSLSTALNTGAGGSSNVTEMRYDSVGPSIGAELKSRSVTAMIIVLLAIVAYIAWAFRKVSKPVASWKYGVAAIIALFHDVMITIGVFSILGHFLGVEVNTPFVAAILTVLGYSVNDTIVVFDRIRENLPKSDDDFEGTINISVNQTIARSINTSLTTLLVLLSILFFGGATIRDFVLALSIGVFVGTYSSIFIASPVLVIWEKFTHRS